MFKTLVARTNLSTGLLSGGTSNAELMQSS